MEYTDNIAIDIKNVTIRFNLGNQKVDNLKEYVIKMIKGELMFQEFLAVRDATVSIKKGESWALVGSNGSGKSTLLKAISGIIKPYRGTIEVNGSIAPLIELSAGFDGEMTARENIILNGCLLGHSRNYMLEHMNEIIDFAELWDFMDSPIKNYSSGMSARLGFAIATMVRPEILIVDEVLAVGDARFRQKCNERMKEMLGNGTTLLLVSHSMDDVKRLCKNALWIEKGEIKAVGKCDDVCRQYEDYLGVTNAN